MVHCFTILIFKNHVNRPFGLIIFQDPKEDWHLNSFSLEAELMFLLGETANRRNISELYSRRHLEDGTAYSYSFCF